MSDLGENVTGEWIRATAAFGHTPKRIPVLMFVEGDDDVVFWKEAVRPYQTKYNITVTTNKSVNPTGGNGKSTLLSMNGLCNEKVVAVDADFDLIVEGYSQYSDMVRNDPFVVNTTWYSIENILVQKTNYISLLEQFSVVSWELFIYYLATIETKQEKKPAKGYGSMMTTCGIQRCVNCRDFAEFYTAYIMSLEEIIESQKTMSLQIKERLNRLGYNERDVWKLIRGHNLWETIVRHWIEEDENRKIDHTLHQRRATEIDVTRNQIMREMGILQGVKDYVPHNFYRGNLENITLPKETRSKLDKIFG